MLWASVVPTAANSWQKRHRTQRVTQLGRSAPSCTLGGYVARPVVVGCPAYRGMQTDTVATCCHRGGRGGRAGDHRPLRIGPHRACALVSIATVAVNFAARRARRQCGPAATYSRAAGLQVVEGVRDRCATQAGGCRTSCAWRRFGGTRGQGLAGSACGAGRSRPATGAGYRPHRSRPFDQVLPSPSLIGQRQAARRCVDGR
jgi:hypothetical protein